MKKRPHILFVVLDTLRRDRLSTYGYTSETSPHLSAFAESAMRFDRAIAPAQWTIPAHGSLFTGLYPTTHQLTQAFQRLPDSYPTLAELLTHAGYHTVAFCNNPLLGLLDNGLQRGFTHFYNYAGATPNTPRDMLRRGALAHSQRALQSFARHVTNQFAQRDWLFNLALHPFMGQFWPALTNFKGNTARSIDDIIAYWDDQQAGDNEQPLFAYVNLMGAHLPYQPPQDVLMRLAPDIARDQAARHWMSRWNADPGAWISPPEPPLTDWQVATLDAYYAAEIACQDAQLGRLLDHLRARGQLDQTLVVIVADHGEGHGDHGFFGHSFVVYQELVHVPLIVRWPDGMRGHHTGNASTRRLFHTILEAASAQPPFDETNPNHDVTALSLARLTEGEDIEGDTAYAEAIPPLTLLNALERRRPETVSHLRLQEIRRGVYQGDHKLATVGETAERLYDIGQDPAEETDHLATAPDLASQLQEHLQGFVERARQQRTSAIMNGRVDASVLDSLRALGYIE